MIDQQCNDNNPQQRPTPPVNFQRTTKTSTRLEKGTPQPPRMHHEAGEANPKQRTASAPQTPAPMSAATERRLPHPGAGIPHRETPPHSTLPNASHQYTNHCVESSQQRRSATPRSDAPGTETRNQNPRSHSARASLSMPHRHPTPSPTQSVCRSTPEHPRAIAAGTSPSLNGAGPRATGTPLARPRGSPDAPSP
ncbi:serine/arginine repetitive matrix protein 1-like [Perca fluviatilis]|uniref:serine/arginine repetitive matrix protein 1-like n=1 Tax=Perca fluviatilis TaxID=8168 RepID=UPI0019643FFD|nr:serine/arginine repetitive matrix protein 1-like [Perca fluviatilis]